MKALAFWAACAAVFFALQLVCFHLGIHRKNWAFAVWLLVGVAAQVAAATIMATGERNVLATVGRAYGWISIALAAAAIIEALARGAGNSDPVNGVIFRGLLAMLAVSALQILAARHGYLIHTSAWAWFRNIGFFGPALWMLLCFSNVNFNSLLARLTGSIQQATGSEWQAAMRSLLG